MNVGSHIEFKREKLADCLVEAADLLRLHWDEIAPYKDLFVLNPNVAFYEEVEAKGILHVITARMDGRLVGYVAMLLAPHAHYRHVLQATDDIHFIHPDYRKGGLGMRLFRETEKMMRDLGAKVMVLRTKAARDHGLLFERLGYNKQDIVYTKRLDGG